MDSLLEPLWRMDGTAWMMALAAIAALALVIVALVRRLELDFGRNRVPALRKLHRLYLAGKISIEDYERRKRDVMQSLEPRRRSV